MAKVLIKSVTISNKGSAHHGKVVDVLVSGGEIKKIGKVTEEVKTTINGKGMILSSGWVDMRAWLADPGLEHKEDLESSRLAAADGGFTHVTALPNNQPVTQTKNDVAYIKGGNAGSLVQLHPIAAVTLGAKGEDLTEMIDLHTAGAIAFSDGLKPIWHSDILLKSLQYLQKFDGLLIDRPEDIHLNMFGVMNEGVESTMLGMKGMPNLSEDLIIQRNLSILAYSGGRLHLTCLSTEKSVALIKEARKKGLNVTCDIASYQPLLDDSALEGFDTSFKVNPPLRIQADNKALIKGLQDGTIDVIVSNHIPHDEECKKLEFDLADFGITSLQTVASNLSALSEKVDMHLLIEKVTTNPRNLLGLDAATIEEGAEADLTLFDPNAKWKLNSSSNKSKSVNSPYFNQELKGKAIAVFNNGQASVSSI
ncbi:dihydroorotase [Fulvivirga lutea]|uniref:Dihydroorotase n=1 Tax=Fulvivirga lutea TaxID=2810512 RepID=A0A974ZZD0_9BACT|nr:dihydroorotase [Fulvivirga lutea]QSE95905.1 dihydroorotase [Fulvivirga lutea]